MAAENEASNPDNSTSSSSLQIPIQRIKRIVKLDNEIDKISSEALFLISSSTELFIHFLAEQSARVAIEKKKRTIKTDHLRLAVKRHRPTSDFLLDSLPMPKLTNQVSEEKDRGKAKADSGKKKQVPFATRSIDAFFSKSS